MSKLGGRNAATFDAPPRHASARAPTPDAPALPTSAIRPDKPSNEVDASATLSDRPSNERATVSKRIPSLSSDAPDAASIEESASSIAGGDDAPENGLPIVGINRSNWSLIESPSEPPA